MKNSCVCYIARPIFLSIYHNASDTSLSAFLVLDPSLKCSEQPFHTFLSSSQVHNSGAIFQMSLSLDQSKLFHS